MDPAAPQVNVSVPGRGAGSSEVLTAGPDGRRPGPLPGWVRALAVSSVLGGLVVAGAQSRSTAPAPGAGTAPPRAPAVPPAAVPTATGVAGVHSTVALGHAAPQPAGAGRYATPITVAVVLRAPDGRRDSGGSPRTGDVALLDVTARGFAVELTRAPPLVLGALDRTSAAPTVVRLPGDVVVTDCAVDARAPRRVELRLRRGDGPVGVLAADVAPDVVRALDRLVSRTCRRPRG